MGFLSLFSLKNKSSTKNSSKKKGGGKNDIKAMKRWCDIELKNMKKGVTVGAPSCFERVAILSRKSKNYKQEIFYCEQYIKEVDAFYSKNGTKNIADVRKGPTYKAIVKRLPKAKALLIKKGS